jgi:hypothetical protein
MRKGEEIRKMLLKNVTSQNRKRKGLVCGKEPQMGNLKAAVPCPKLLELFEKNFVFSGL